MWIRFGSDDRTRSCRAKELKWRALLVHCYVFCVVITRSGRPTQSRSRQRRRCREEAGRTWRNVFTPGRRGSRRGVVSSNCCKVTNSVRFFCGMGALAVIQKRLLIKITKGISVLRGEMLSVTEGIYIPTWSNGAESSWLLLSPIYQLKC